MACSEFAIDPYERGNAFRRHCSLREKAMAAWGSSHCWGKDRIRKLAKDGDPVFDAAEDESLQHCFARARSATCVARLLYCDVTSEALAHSLATEWPSGASFQLRPERFSAAMR